MVFASRNAIIVNLVQGEHPQNAGGLRVDRCF